MALISFAVTAKLICAFVFAYGDCWFSHAAAQIMSSDQVYGSESVTLLQKKNSLICNYQLKVDACFCQTV